MANIILNSDDKFTKVDKIEYGNIEITFQKSGIAITALVDSIKILPDCNNKIFVGVTRE